MRAYTYRLGKGPLRYGRPWWMSLDAEHWALTLSGYLRRPHRDGFGRYLPRLRPACKLVSRSPAIDPGALVDVLGQGTMAVVVLVFCTWLLLH